MPHYAGAIPTPSANISNMLALPADVYFSPVLWCELSLTLLPPPIRRESTYTYHLFDGMPCIINCSFVAGTVSLFSYLMMAMCRNVFKTMELVQICRETGMGVSTQTCFLRLFTYIEFEYVQCSRESTGKIYMYRIVTNDGSLEGW